MKKIISLFLISWFLFIGGVHASVIEPTVNMEMDITENRITLILGFTGTDTMAISHEIGYNRKYLKLDEIQALDNFTLTQSKITTSGSFNTIKILADSDYSFKGTNYAVVVFEVLDSFKVKANTDIYFYNYEASGPSKIKGENKGFILNARHDSFQEMSYTKKNITKYTKIEYMIMSNIIYIGIFLLVIVILIILLVLKPKKGKSSKEEVIAYSNNDIEPISLGLNNVEMPKVVNENISKENLTMEEKQEEVLDKPLEENKILTPTNPNTLGVVNPLNIEESDKKNINIIILFIISLSWAFLGSANAVEYDINNLREYLVSNKKYDKKYDYNHDSVVDILDLIETKNTVNVSYEDKLSQQNPNFGELNGYSTTTTTIETSTTTTQIVNPKPTIKTTKKSEAVSPTTKTTSKTQSTTTADNTFTATFIINNGTVSNKTGSAQKGKSVSTEILPNVGYTYESVSCTNGQYASFKSNVITVSRITADTTCEIKLKTRSDMKVIVTAINGPSRIVPIKGKFMESGSTSAKAPDGYTYDSYTCNNGLTGIYENGTFTITSLINDGACTIKFIPIKYNVMVKDSTNNTMYSESLSYGLKTSIKVQNNKEYKTLKCNGSIITFNKAYSEYSGIWAYTFDLTVKKDTTCIFS